VTRNKILIPVLALAAAAAAFWFLALAPKREQIAKLDSDIAAKQKVLEQSEDQVASYTKAKGNYRANYAKVARLGKAVTSDDDVRSLIVQLDDAARRSKVEFTKLNVGEGGGGTSADTGAAAAAPGTVAPPPGSVPVGSAGFSAMPFSLSFKGTYFNLSEFFTRLERFVTVENRKIDVTGRLLLLGNITVTPQTGQDDKPGQLVAEIGAASYLVPPAEGVAGTATPDSPTGASGAPPASGGTTPPTTTATITGVR
jgi:Tfp pilus assembly protein PilO